MVKMERVAAVFRRGNVSLWNSSSGSDHSQEKSTDLLDLVKSFIERDDDTERHQEEDKPHNNLESESDGNFCDSYTENKLRILFGSRENENERRVKEKIQVEAEQALQLTGARSFQGYNRQLMAHLRKRGFDAGLCKSKWEKFRSFPAGNHEYIDVNIDGTRYIIEIYLAGEFEIARPTSKYTSLLNIFPEIFVGKLQELKEVVKLMCAAMKESMKNSEMHVPPWRRNGYMQAKWSGSYRRTTNGAPVHKFSETYPEKNSISFKALSAVAYRCREDLGRKADLKVGYLTTALSRNELKL